MGIHARCLNYVQAGGNMEVETISFNRYRMQEAQFATGISAKVILHTWPCYCYGHLYKILLTYMVLLYTFKQIAAWRSMSNAQQIERKHTKFKN